MTLGEIGLKSLGIEKNAIYNVKTGKWAKYFVDNFSSMPESSQVSSVCVCLGLNNPDDTSSMKQLIDKLASKYSDKKIYIQRVFPVTTGYKEMNYSVMNKKIDAYNSTIKQYCDKYSNVYYIDATSGTTNFIDSSGNGDASKYNSTGYHLKNDYYSKWVENIKNAIGQSGGSGTSSGTTGTTQNTSTDVFENMMIVGDSWGVLLKEKKILTNVKYDVVGGKDARYFLQHTDEMYDNSEISSVYLQIGINDANYNIEPMKKLIDKMVEKYPGKNIYVQRAFPVTSTFHYSSKYATLDASYNNDITKYNTAIKEYCDKYNNVYFIDATKGFVDSDGYGDKSKYASDGLHLDYNHNEYYTAWVSNIREAIAQATGNATSTTSQGTGKWVAKVAYWTETTNTVTSNDPEVNTGSSTTYMMTTKDINYLNAIKGYTLPFDYLWAWLVVTEDKNFVLDVANLVYNGSIEITVFDNLSINVSTSEKNYTRTITDVDEKGVKKFYKVNYYIKTTTTVKDDSIVVDVTKANVWIVDYEKEYKYEKSDDGSNTYSAQPAKRRDKIDKGKNPKVCVDIENSLDDLIEKNKDVITEKKDAIEKGLEKSTEKYKEYEFNVKNVKYKIVHKKKRYYLYRVPEESEDDNFVKALVRNKKAFSSIQDSSSWLFKILEKNEPDMIELTKYLIYVATNRLYDDISNYNFDVFNPADFEDINSGFVGSTLEEQIWWMLKDIGYSDYAAAGAMGNLSAETDSGSSIHSDAEEVKGSDKRGIGIVQWSFGRHTNLVKYAESKGTTWKDETVQLEFFKAELTGGGCNGLASDEWSGFKSQQKQFLAAQSTKDAAYYFDAGFERSGGSRLDVRYKGAEYYYNMFHGKTRPSGGGYSGEGTVFYQGDYANVQYGSSTIAKCGCGPTSFSMVASDLTGRTITPKDVVAWSGNRYYVSGAGTGWNFFGAAANHFGFNCINLGNNINSAIAQLKMGHLVIVSQGPGLFTSGGHYIVLSSITSDGGIRVRDPNGRNARPVSEGGRGYNTRVFTASEISRAAKNYWAFYK